MLTIAAVAWAVPTTRRALGTAIALTLVWVVAAVDPSNLTERFSDDDTIAAYSIAATRLDASVLISNDADGVHWDTGIPAAYAPTPVKMLTGEEVDVEPIYRDLPCALRRANGAIVLSDQAMFFAVDLALLDESVTAGRLDRTTLNGAIVYEPTASACD